MILSSGILIFVSFFLGYMQGRKWKKRKYRNEIKELEERNKELQKELEDAKRIQTLKMFSGHANVKGNRKKFEQDLTAKMTVNSDNRECVIQTYALLMLLNAGANDLVSNKYIENNIIELNRLNAEGVANSWKAKINVGSETRHYDIQTASIAFNKFVDRILSFDDFHLSLEECKDSFEYIINNF